MTELSIFEEPQLWREGKRLNLLKGIVMAIYHCSAKIIGRSSGRSAVGSAAYRSGEELHNEYDGLTHDYRRKKGIEYTEIMLPANAPAEFSNRQILWNSVEKVEKSKDAQLAREVEIALPVELTREEQIALVREYAQVAFVSRGMVADIAIHDRDTGNPHAHIMLTVRALDEQGQWLPKKRKEYILDAQGNKQYNPKKKTYKFKTVTTTDWNERENMELWRSQWSQICNQALEKKGLPDRIDHRSYARQGVSKAPTIHLGYVTSDMEKKGKQSRRGAINRDVASGNALIKEIPRLEQELDKLGHQAAPPAAEDIAKSMVDLFRQYIQLENEIYKNREDREILETQDTRLWQTQESLKERAAEIPQRQGQVKKLETELSQLGLLSFKKKEVKLKLERAETGLGDAIRLLKEKYGIQLGGVDRKLHEMQQRRRDTRKYIDKMPSEQEFRQRQELLWNQYGQEYAKAMSHPEREKIFIEVESKKRKGIYGVKMGLRMFEIDKQFRKYYPLQQKNIVNRRQERGRNDGSR